jgi:putative methyltransferase (TIGR04325 family)
VSTIERARRIFGRLQTAPGVKQAAELYYERQFRNWPGAFRGVFHSFEAALQSAPQGRTGYDHPELGGMYVERRFRIYEADYPILFWLSRILGEHRQVFDFGGHVGLAFYGFESYLDYPADLTWTVYDVPSVLAEGRKFAEQHPRAALRFSGELSELAQHSVLHASGALQYVETPLAQQLEQLGARPKHLLLNKLPLYEGEPFVTLQNTVHAYNPYAVYNREAYVASLEALGYRVIDSWDDWERSCRPLNQPDYQVPHYWGLYLRLDNPG